MNAFRAIAQREQNAFESFVSYCEGKGFSHAEGIHIWNVFLKLRLMTIDHVNGTFHVKHGALLDKGALQAAVEATA